MKTINLEECIKVLVEIGNKYTEKDGAECYKAISANNEFLYIPMKKSIYIRDLSFEAKKASMSGTIIKKNDLPFLILDQTNFGQADIKLFNALLNFVKNYQQMIDLEKELLVNKE